MMRVHEGYEAGLRHMEAGHDDDDSGQRLGGCQLWKWGAIKLILIVMFGSCAVLRP